MSKNVALVSVWMTTYNHEKYISDAIEGVVNQKTSFPFELVIGEDKSSDKTREICLRYKELYPDIIKLIINPTNIGLISNYNETLQECNGKYIAYCDGDDYWTDLNKLQKQVDFLEADKSIDMVFTEKHVQKGQEIFKSERTSEVPDTTFESIILSNMICSPTILIRAEIAKKYSLIVTKTALERNWLTFDYPLWLEVSMSHRIGFIPEATCVYRIVQDSGSHPDDIVKAYLWDKCLLDIQLYYFRRYNSKNFYVGRKFRSKFNEMIFHSRKGMILQYGRIAGKEIFNILKMNPLFYFYLIYSKLGRVFRKSQSN
jgi:glycosyltransferase involved in cell wall biosynthesis